MVDRFLAAAGGGDINALMEILAPEVTLWTDGGGKVRQARRPIGTFTFTMNPDGQIAEIHNVANPAKLGAVQGGRRQSLGTDLH